jgi:glycosyltransferase involved in cell wall biosynthesis
LLSLGHSYVVAANRRPAHEMTRAGGGRWEITTAAPEMFHGQDDLCTQRLRVAPHEPCPVVPLPAFLTHRIHIFFYGNRLRELLQQGWDLVHCWEEPYIVAGGQVAWCTPRQTPLVYRTGQSYSKRYPPPFNCIERYAMRRAAGWLCSAQTVAQALANRHGYAGRPTRIIPLGVDLETFRPDPAAACAVRKTLGWEGTGPPVVGFLGRFVPEKGLGLLTRVLDGLDTPWQALFVGAGRLEPMLRRWAALHGDRVRICTAVQHDQVPPYLAAMDVLCVPSQTTPNWREQFGRMLVEAFACGVPVIGSDSGEIPHVIGDAGLVAGERDPAGWQAAMASLLESPARRAELAARGLQRVRQRYAWPLIARQYLDFFDEVPASRHC